MYNIWITKILLKYLKYKKLIYKKYRNIFIINNINNRINS